jgi:hypothetical protein
MARPAAEANEKGSAGFPFLSQEDDRKGGRRDAAARSAAHTWRLRGYRCFLQEKYSKPYYWGRFLQTHASITISQKYSNINSCAKSTDRAKPSQRLKSD